MPALEEEGPNCTAGYIRILVSTTYTVCTDPQSPSNVMSVLAASTEARKRRLVLWRATLVARIKRGCRLESPVSALPKDFEEGATGFLYVLNVRYLLGERTGCFLFLVCVWDRFVASRLDLEV